MSFLLLFAVCSLTLAKRNADGNLLVRRSETVETVDPFSGLELFGTWTAYSVGCTSTGWQGKYSAMGGAVPILSVQIEPKITTFEWLNSELALSQAQQSQEQGMVADWFRMQGPVSNDKVEKLFCHGPSVGSVSFRMSFDKACSFWQPTALAKLCPSLKEASQTGEGQLVGDESKPIQQHVEAPEVQPEAPEGPRSEPSDPFDGIQLQGEWSAAPSNGCTGNGWEGRYMLTSGKFANTEILHIEIEGSSTTFKFWDTLTNMAKKSQKTNKLAEWFRMEGPQSNSAVADFFCGAGWTEEGMKRSLAVLVQHHSWNTLSLPDNLVPVLEMTWHCKPCNVPNNPTAERCKKCGEPWAKVWTGPKKRSTSRHASRAKKEKEKKDKGGKEEKTKELEESPSSWNIFPGRAPWMDSTPQTRLPREVTVAPLQAVPPPPPTRAPPPIHHPPPGQGEGLNSDEQMLLKHLKGLQALSVEMPEGLLDQLRKLEEKDKKQCPPLNHSHLNKLHKLQNQVTAAAAKVNKVDEEWKQFVAQSLTRLQQHGAMFTAYRATLVEAYQQKHAELQAIKETVSQASALIGSTTQQQEDFPPAPEVLQGMQEFHRAAEQLQQVPVLQIRDDDEEDDEMQEASGEENEESENKAKRAGKSQGSNTLQAFGRAATSPNKTKVTFPNKESIGVQTDGSFATSALKEYPPALCKALAFAFGDQFEAELRQGRGRLFAQTPFELDQWVRELNAISAEVHVGAHMRADYQGG
eukprot:Skav203140  [mRNA]  locus=scaffold2782:11299:25210:+ [translate_table: standard]